MKTHKKCRGIGKALNYGCGKELPIDMFGKANFKYGLGISCGCFSSWLLNSDNGKKMKQKAKINFRSDKRAEQEKLYLQLRKAFLNKKENQICPIFKTQTTDIHHKKGRIGDLLLNTKYWVALSREGHKLVEENPNWAKENGYSLNRLSND